MGRNSKQRRDAKRRKAGGSRRPAVGAGEDFRFGPTGPSTDGFAWSGPTQADRLALADLAVVRQVRGLVGGTLSDDEIHRRARNLVDGARPIPVSLLAEAMQALLVRLLTTVVQTGWCPDDLRELVARRVGAEHLPLLVGLLDADARRTTGLSPAWQAQLSDLGRVSTTRRPDSVEGLADGLRIAALLAGLPEVAATIPRTGTARLRTGEAESEEAHRKLATVRALLAKAESTLFDEEAEALSAKAQELIGRYALERLVQRDQQTGEGPDVSARRFWLDAPYVLAKATLVDEVATANRCRTVVSDTLGFSTLIGDPVDLDAVELLATSLLVQCSAAMVRHGSQVDARGASSTRSFRQAFIVSYASRIGERLRRVTQETVRASEDTARLLPALRDQEARVSEAFDLLFPHVVEKTTTVSNQRGWVAGRVAADLASLEIRERVAQGS